MKRTAFFFAVALFTLVLFNHNSNAQTVGNGRGTKLNWVDANGDGICDVAGTPNQGANRTGKGYGKRDGTGTQLRPQDGTGLGNKGGNQTATGTHDGTGPKGGRRGGK